MSGHPLPTTLRDHAAGAEAPSGLEAHLRECPACLAAIESERRLLAEIDATLEEARLAEPSPALLVRVRSLAQPSPARRRSLPVAWAVAAALMLGVCIALLQRVAPTPATTPTPVAAATTPATALPEPPPVTRPAVVFRVSRLPVPSAPLEAPALPVLPPGQEKALARFAELMASGAAVVPAHLLDREAPIPEPPDLDRPLLTIEPIEAEEAPSEE